MSTTYELFTYFGNASIKFDGSEDANDAKWYITDEQGWTQLPPLRQQSMDFSSQHGSLILPTYYDKRPIVLKGVCKASTEANAVVSRGTLGALMAAITGVNGWLYVTEGDTTLLAGVYATGQVRITPPMGTGSFEFEIPLVAPDPRKYAETWTEVEHTTGTATYSVHNLGTIDTYPVVVMDGAGPISITNLDDVFNNSTVATKSGANMNSDATLDFQKKTVARVAAPYTAFDKIDLAATNWWSIPPGGAIDVSLGATAMTFKYRHAYI